MSPVEKTSGILGISIFSAITGLTKRALRLYEEKELLVPVKREITGYRYYAYNQIIRGIQLKNLSYMGFSIKDMETICKALDGECEDIAEIIEQRKKEVSMEIEHLDIVKGLLSDKNFLEVMRLDETKPQIKEVADLRVVSRRERGKYGEVIPKLMTDLLEQISNPENQKLGVKQVGPPMFICYSGNEHGGDIGVAVPIAGKINVTTETEIKTIHGGKVVSLLQKGPYDEVGDTYKAAYNYLYSNGLKQKGATRELYLNDPDEVPKSEYLTEIQIPVE